MLTAGALAVLALRTPRTSPSPPGPTAPAFAAAPATDPRLSDPRLRPPSAAISLLSDAERTQRLLGSWTTRHHGRQRIINRADGTASLDIEFDFLAGLLYGSHMRLELTWKIEQGVLTNVIQRGSPAANVERLKQDFGNSCRYRMLELSDTRLLLQEIDDPASLHEWVRSTP